MHRIQKIIAEAKAEDVDSQGSQLGKLLEIYRPLLGRVAQGQIGNNLRVRVSESDLVQETLLSASQKFCDFRGSTEEEFRCWLLKIFRSRLSDGLRRHVLAERRRVTQQEPGSLISRADANPSPSSQLIASEQVARLLDAILLLDPNDQSILLMRYAEQMGFEEISLRLKLPMTTVWRRWSQAVDTLRKIVPE